ncbi:argininosuccinate synthase [Candidatus Hydrogenisulfobacillus filiaventi]|uniref:Argininosuccinate synthase n=1 Tax=Candidatus Hydrogenisulfobacillus filiaventi TaxID=2707344 RepID=A0A6F8ZIH9_9FIRM|nr:argininosuccinate synthase [Candidatus Hydrogenisulfobacillus filiaventi]
MPQATIQPGDTVVLAYSGGLDTSIIIPWLRETYGARVVAFCADVGQGDDLEAVRAKALASGAADVVIRDLRERFLTEYAFPVMQAGAVYEGVYLLGTAIARPLMAAELVAVAREVGARAVAHGATGKGNDQVRFELGVRALAPDLAVIAPWREWSITGRLEAMEYARAHGVPVSATPAAPYSRDQNLWHISHEGGVLEDPGTAAPEDVYLWTRNPVEAPAEPETVAVAFERGVPVAVDGRALGPVALMEVLNTLGARHGVGRVSMVENRLVGMKSRGVYETPGGTILYAAHQALEALTLDRETAEFKRHVALKYARLVYDGLWFTPLREALAAFVQETQRTVTGEVQLVLYKGQVSAVAARSPYSLYSQDLATFDGGEYDHKDAAGFIRLFGLPLAVRHAAMQRAGGEAAR